MARGAGQAARLLARLLDLRETAGRLACAGPDQAAISRWVLAFDPCVPWRLAVL